MNARRCVLAAAAAVVLWPALGAAHDLGTTQVRLDVAPDRSVTVAIDVDPDALLQRLQIAAGDEAIAVPAEPHAVTAGIERRAPTFLSNVALLADGQPVTLRFTYVEAAPKTDRDSAPSTVRLTGAVAQDARELTWRYDLPLGSYALRVNRAGQPEAVQWLVGGRASAPVPLSAGTHGDSTLAVTREYLWLGIVHIVPRGLDHILFVLGLFLLRRNWRPLLAQVSVFTVAHSITLALSVTSTFSLPGRIVEPLIGASIAWVAIGNLRASALTPARLGVVFLFGLLHGLGFAGVLTDLGLPAGALAVALASFNVGVELGQLAVLAIAVAATSLIARRSLVYRQWVTVPASAAIAAIGLYWTVTRSIGG